MKEHERQWLPAGRVLGYAEYGDPAGEPLFYFHGWPSSRYQGKLLDAAAAKNGLRVIAPDRPGFGLSDPLPGRSFASWPRDVAALADALGIERFRVQGVSGGGPYALATAWGLPERVLAAAIVCGAPPLAHPGDRAGLHWIYRTLIDLRRLRHTAAGPLIRLSRWMLARGRERFPLNCLLHGIPARDRAALADPGCWESVVRSYLEAVRGGPAELLAEGELYLAPWDFAPEEIRIPIAFWHGLDDRNLPCAAARNLAARVPGAEAHWVAGEGHYSLPLHFQHEVLDWLRRH